MLDEHAEELSPRVGYPLFLDLQGRQVTVIGAGAVASRKVATLLEHGARVRVIAPDAAETIRTAAAEGVLEWLTRPYQNGDLSGCTLAFCACGVPAVDEAVREEACQAGCLLNVVDVPKLCDFTVPALVSRGPLRIAVSTSGTAPSVAKAIRRHLEDEFDTSWEAYLSLLGALREDIQDRIAGGEHQRRPYYEAACELHFRERLAAGEELSVSDAYAEIRTAVMSAEAGR
jgi:precorrin-2 dehydrogenase / sirohydrochlorin ferrochelatase